MACFELAHHMESNYIPRRLSSGLSSLFFSASFLLRAIHLNNFLLLPHCIQHSKAAIGTEIHVFRISGTERYTISQSVHSSGLFLFFPVLSCLVVPCLILFCLLSCLLFCIALYCLQHFLLMHLNIYESICLESKGIYNKN